MKIKALLTCDKVIQDKDSATPSLITIFQNFYMGNPDGVEIPADAVIPRDWALFSIWNISKDEEGAKYSQVMQVLWPNGQTFLEARLDAVTDAEERLIYIARFTGFPIGQAGDLVIKAWIELDGLPVSDVEQTAIRVKIVPVAEASQNGSPERIQPIAGIIP